MKNEKLSKMENYQKSLEEKIHFFIKEVECVYSFQKKELKENKLEIKMKNKYTGNIKNVLNVSFFKEKIEISVNNKKYEIIKEDFNELENILKENANKIKEKNKLRDQMNPQRREFDNLFQQFTKKEEKINELFMEVNKDFLSREIENFIIKNSSKIISSQKITCEGIKFKIKEKEYLLKLV